MRLIMLLMRQLRIGIFSGAVGWNPDYEDPSTYLDILKSTNSEQTKTYMGYDDPSNAAAAKVGMKDYDKIAR